MLVSIVMAAHNEGDLLWKTVASCQETCSRLNYEIVVVDDASPDRSITELRRRFPEVAVLRQDRRLGPSPTKDLAARSSRGEILVFLDAHCKPEAGAIERLVEDVEATEGNAIITPSVPGLDPEAWVNKEASGEYLYGMDLEIIDGVWLSEKPSQKQRFYDCPGLIGCAFALPRSLYERLWGFDPDMFVWGIEDVELGVKAWLMGHPVQHDPDAVIGHRFQKHFVEYRVDPENVITNRLRMACKIFSFPVWQEWLDRCRERVSVRVWEAAWSAFCARRGSAERERAYLMRHRVHDEFWYAERFGLSWPKRR